MAFLAHGDDGIDQDHEIGPATDPLDGIRRLRIARVEMRAGGRGQMPAGREADDADAFGIDRPTPWPATRTVRMARWASSSGTKRLPVGKPILQHDPGDAVPIEPVGDAVSFGARHQAAVAAARADDDRGAVGLRGAMHRDGRVGRLGNRLPDGCVIGPE